MSGYGLLQGGESHSRLDGDGEIIRVVFRYLSEAFERENQADGGGDVAEVEMLAGAAWQDGKTVSRGNPEQVGHFLFAAGTARPRTAFDRQRRTRSPRRKGWRPRRWR